MSKKRRVFDIDFPTDPVEEETAAPVPAGTEEAEVREARRGPMASAIQENASALRERQAAEAAIREENDRLAHDFVRMKKQGLIVDLVAIDAVSTSKLTRDRSITRDPDLDELKISIRELGLSNPIRVEQVGDGYELVQGFRRLTAYRELFAETGDERFAKIPAGLMSSGEALDGLYRRMVDENLVRRDISFAEMAALARAYAADPETECANVEEAVAILYASANRQKRSYIRHFATLLDHIGGALKFPEAIPRALGLDLEKKFADDAAAVTRAKSRLAAAMATTAEAEIEVLRGLLTEVRKAEKKAPAGKANTLKTTFRMTVPAGTVRCAVQDGRLELRSDMDFGQMEKQKLEAALAAFFAELDS
ncbi:ParB N-terminal domain-containing protein [Celeribacter naphthalenivorans]|uniref:ParB N-terminal domain-containing protein n=1 Tax=Celeribacter naphthalenivorans TaxID=1614694 RepID=UPI001CFA1D0D|nr:ParB N-terminal domain-containing protein [Celeribacter naphthalenivorans]